MLGGQRTELVAGGGLHAIIFPDQIIGSDRRTVAP
jgi:hypothetical protein